MRLGADEIFGPPTDLFTGGGGGDSGSSFDWGKLITTAADTAAKVYQTRTAAKVQQEQIRAAAANPLLSLPGLMPGANAGMNPGDSFIMPFPGPTNYPGGYYPGTSTTIRRTAAPVLSDTTMLMLLGGAALLAVFAFTR